MSLKKRALGKTGMKVTEIGFGGIPIQRVSEDEAVKVVRKCYELGINYFDTARGYTTSEARIGLALKDVRDDVFIATKSHAKLAKELNENLEKSLDNLKTNYIDLYQLHNVSNEQSWETIKSKDGALQGLIEARDKGKVLHIGVTSHSPQLLMKIIEEDIFESIMVGYNYLAVEPEKELLPRCRKLGIGSVIMKPFGGGALSNSNTALKYIIANKDVDVVIPGMMTVKEVEENIKICQGNLTLTSEELSSIKNDKELLGDQFCSACDYCQPCPAGISISFVLRTEQSALKRMGWNEGIVKQTKDMASKVEGCLQCGECESRCPYQLPIRQLIPEKMGSLLKRLETRSIP